MKNYADLGGCYPPRPILEKVPTFPYRNCCGYGLDF